MDLAQKINEMTDSTNSCRFKGMDELKEVEIKLIDFLKHYTEEMKLSGNYFFKKGDKGEYI